MTKATRTIEDDRAFLADLFKENPMISPEAMNERYSEWQESQPPLSCIAPPKPKDEPDDEPEQDVEVDPEGAEPDPRDGYWPGYLGGSMPENYTPVHKLKEPDIKVPSRHDLDSDGISKLVSEYRAEYARINGLTSSDYSVAQAESAFRKKVNAQSRSILAQRERMEAREKAEAKEKADRLAAAEKERRDAARAEIEAIKDHKRRHWLETGGTEDGFDAYWSTHGEAEVVTERMRRDEERVARPGRSY